MWRHHHSWLALLPNVRWDHSRRYSPIRGPVTHGWPAELHLAFKPHGNLFVRQKFSTFSQAVSLVTCKAHPSPPAHLHPCSLAACPHCIPKFRSGPAQAVKAPANSKISHQWNLYFSVFYQDSFLEAFEIFFLIFDYFYF